MREFRRDGRLYLLVVGDLVLIQVWDFLKKNYTINSNSHDYILWRLNKKSVFCIGSAWGSLMLAKQKFS